MNSKKFWLMKSEPDVFSIEDLKIKKRSLWDGVRNFQARNYMTQEMSVGDCVIFYHSNAKPSGAAGVARVSKPATPDPLQWDLKSEYYDKRSTKEKPLWFCVEVEFQEKFPKVVPLDELRKSKLLRNLVILRKGNRLSITPLTASEFQTICELGALS